MRSRANKDGKLKETFHFEGNCMMVLDARCRTKQGEDISMDILRDCEGMVGFLSEKNISQSKENAGETIGMILVSSAF